MIRVASFLAETPQHIDRKLEKFCVSNGITRDMIIKIYFYALNGDNDRGDLHVGKLVFDIDQDKEIIY